MKPASISIFILFLIVSSCQNESKTNLKQFNSEWEFTVQNFQPDEKTKLNFASDPFSVRSTADLMSKLLLSNTSLNNLVRSKGIGGVFEAKYLTIKQGMGGIRLWYCYNPSDKAFPEFFLALEQIAKYNYQDPEELPSESFIVADPFLYTSKDEDLQTTSDFIAKHATGGVINVKIDKARVVQFAKNFKSLISIISPNPNDPYCKYAIAFFENNKPYDDFMKENPSYVRYYFGLSLDSQHKPNYLRPILAGVDSAGATRVANRITTTDPFLQKSVPPPPVQ